MTIKAVCRIEKIKQKQQISASGNHVYRFKGTAPNANPNVKNLALIRPSHNNIRRAVEDRIEATGVKVRYNPHHPQQNSVLAVEVVLSASPEFFKDGDIKKRNKWAVENTKWLKKEFGEENVVSAILHLDEKTPHLHAHVVPIAKNKKGKLTLNAKNWFDGRGKLSELQTSYGKAMAKFGIERGTFRSKAKHQDIGTYYYYVNKLEQPNNSLLNVPLPPMFGKKKREEYRDNIEKEWRADKAEISALRLENERLRNCRDVQYTEKLEREKEEAEDRYILMKEAYENRENDLSRDQDDWLEYKREKEREIEQLLDDNERLDRQNKELQEKNQKLYKVVQKYEPSTAPTPSYHPT